MPRPPSPPTTFPYLSSLPLLLRLPIEVLDQVTDHACLDDPKTSRILRIVSSSFYHRASLHTFKIIRVLATSGCTGLFASPEAATSFFAKKDAAWTNAVRQLILVGSASKVTCHPTRLLEEGLSLISLFPNVQVLELQNVLLAEPTPMPSRLPHRACLTTLLIADCTIALVCLDSLLSGLPTVTHLELARSRAPDGFPHLFRDDPIFPVADNVRHMHVMLGASFCKGEERRIFLRCPAMRTLKVSGITSEQMDDDLAFWIYWMCDQGCTALLLWFCKLPKPISCEVVLIILLQIRTVGVILGHSSTCHPLCANWNSKSSMTISRPPHRRSRTFRRVSCI